MQRHLAHMIGGIVGLASCAFDSGGVTSSAESGLGTPTTGGSETSTTSTSADDTRATSAGSSDADTSSSIDSTAATTGEPLDPCADGGGCDVDATCSPDPSGEVAVCDCNAGFVGNGLACAIAPTMAMLRAESDCGTSALGYCIAGDGHAEVPLVGEPGVVYTVTLRVRGVVELKSYGGGAPDGLWHPDGDPGDFDLRSDVTLSIAATAMVPAQTIRLNSGSSGSSCVLVDMTHDVMIEAGAIVSLSFDSVDGSQIDNGDDLVVPGIPPAPDAFDGQFVQIDAVAIAKV